jgi:hypothetical protein
MGLNLLVGLFGNLKLIKMIKYRYDIEQGSENWHDIRVGKITASGCSDLLMDKKTKGYTNLINRIVEEKTTGLTTESNSFKGNAFTERGTLMEPMAREDYEMRTFDEVEIIGVIELNDLVLCSPDGLIGENRHYNAKCPIFATQREYLKKIKANKGMTDNQLLYKLNSGYYKQAIFELFVSGRKDSVFNSYHPNLPAIDLIIERDEVMIAEIESRYLQAKAEIETEILLLKTLA